MQVCVLKTNCTKKDSRITLAKTAAKLLGIKTRPTLERLEKEVNKISKETGIYIRSIYISANHSGKYTMLITIYENKQLLDSYHALSLFELYAKILLYITKLKDVK